MRYWDTPDKVTNVNLAYLEAISQDKRPPFDAERVTDRFIGVIEVMRMLPSSIRKRFELDLYIGSLAYSWSPERRAAKVLELCDALARGLDLVANDPELRKGGSADFSDRPQSRGEVILAALDAFKRQFSNGHFYNELSALRSATYGTTLQRDVAEIDRILARKRWNGHTSPEYEVYRKIHEMDFTAQRYHREPA